MLVLVARCVSLSFSREAVKEMSFLEEADGTCLSFLKPESLFQKGTGCVLRFEEQSFFFFFEQEGVVTFFVKMEGKVVLFF